MEADADGGAPAGKDIPIAHAWSAGWQLLFTRFTQLFPLILLPALLAYGLQTSAWAEKIAKSNEILSVFGLQILNVAIFSLVATGAYAVALGKVDRDALIRVHVGRPEISFIAAKVVFWTIFFLLYVGALLTAQRLIAFLREMDAVISTASAQASDEEWARQLTLLGMIAVYGPLATAATVFTWFGTRFALVFPQTMATGRLRIFAAMALTKGRSWQVFALLRHLALQLILIYSLAGWYGGFGPYGLANRNAPQEQPSSAGQYVLGKSAKPAQQKKPVPKWVEPVSLVLLGTIWQIVFAGALAHAYRAVAPAFGESTTMDDPGRS